MHPCPASFRTSMNTNMAKFTAFRTLLWSFFGFSFCSCFSLAVVWPYPIRINTVHCGIFLIIPVSLTADSKLRRDIIQRPALHLLFLFEAFGTFFFLASLSPSCFSNISNVNCSSNYVTGNVV